MVADPQTERTVRSYLGHGADQHAPGARDRVLHLAAGTHDVEHLGADRSPVNRGDLTVDAPVAHGELVVGGRVEVEQLDVDAHLVLADPWVVVESLRGLRQRHGGARGLQHPMQPVGRRNRHTSSIIDTQQQIVPQYLAFAGRCP